MSHPINTTQSSKLNSVLRSIVGEQDLPLTIGGHINAKQKHLSTLFNILGSQENLATELQMTTSHSKQLYKPNGT